MIPQAGAWWDAMDGDGVPWTTHYSQAQYETDRVNQLHGSGITWNVNTGPVPATASLSLQTAMNTHGLFYPANLSLAEANNYTAHADRTQSGTYNSSG